MISNNINVRSIGQIVQGKVININQEAPWSSAFAEKESAPAIKILFLAANPKDTDHLRLSEEVREIQTALRKSNLREAYDFRQEWAVRIEDLQEHLLRHQPHLVHFSGHGSAANGLMLEDMEGYCRTVSERALGKLFSVLKDDIRCVVLNACYSAKQASAIAKHIDCVVGMSRAVSDVAAIQFSTAFYRALGFGRDVRTAFELGCSQIDLAGLDEHDTPQLLARNMKPEELKFV
jgi:CHAT domain-containing protein